MINRVILTGRLARDPELRKTQSGLSVCSFQLAVDRPKQKGQDDAVTDWISCQVWRQAADYICNYAKKGALLAVDSRHAAMATLLVRKSMSRRSSVSVLRSSGRRRRRAVISKQDQAKVINTLPTEDSQIPTHQVDTRIHLPTITDRVRRWTSARMIFHFKKGYCNDQI